MQWSWNWLVFAAAGGLALSVTLAGVAYLRCRMMIGRAIGYWTRAHGGPHKQPAVRLLMMHVASESRFLAVPFFLGLPFWLGAIWAAGYQRAASYTSGITLVLDLFGGALLLWLGCRSLIVIRKNSYQGAMAMASRAWTDGESVTKP